MRLARRDGFPDGLLDIGPRDIRRVLPQPTLIRTPGRKPRPLFVSMLLHGNETTSFFVLQDLARAAAAREPARSLLIFVGAVEAAEAGVRLLDGAADFNRVWAGGEGPEAQVAAEVLAEARAAAPFASIDIHNTTGANPAYACVNRLEPQHVGLAALFSRIIVHYENPPTTQSIAFSAICPATTIECGRPGDPVGRARATAFVEDVMRLEALPAHLPKPGDAALYHTAGRVEVAPDASFAFEGAADVVFAADFDRLNFTELPPGSVLAHVAGGAMPLVVLDEARRDVTDRFLVRDGDQLRLVRAATPAMLTTDAAVVRQDCVGYLMERIPSSAAP